MNSMQRELERKVKEQLRQGKIDISALPSESIILKALQDNVKNPRGAYCCDYNRLGCCPDVEYYTILAEENKLIHIEIDLEDSSFAPIIKVQNVQNYRRGLRGRENNARIKAAVELMKEDIEALME